MKKSAERTFIIFAILPILFLSIFVNKTEAASNQWEPITPPGTSGYIFNSIAVSGNYIYLATDHGVYKSSDRGVTWSQMNTGLSSHLNVTTIVIGRTYDELTDLYVAVPSSYVFIGTTDGGVYASTVAGSTWTSTSTGLLDSNIIDLEIDQSQVAHGSYTNIYATAPSGVYISTTTGSFWRRIISGLNGQPISIKTSYVDKMVYVLTDADEIYASDLYSYSGTYESWTKIYDSNGTTTNSLGIFNSIGSLAWLATEKGIYKSNDSGNSFSSTSIGLGNFSVKNVASDYFDTNIVYAALYGDGIYRSTNEAIESNDPNNPEWMKINYGLSDMNIKQIEPDPASSQFVYAIGDSGVYRLSYDNAMIGEIDMSPPSDVTDLSATSGGSYITLSWTAPGGDYRYGTSTSYDIRYSTSPINAGNFSSATEVVPMPTPWGYGHVTTYNVPNITISGTYYFAMKASDGVFTSGLSNVASIEFTKIDTENPNPPTNVSATAISTSRIDLTWSAATDNFAIASYSIYRCADSSCYPYSLIASGLTSLSFNDTDLSPSTTYGYYIMAFDTSGYYSISSVVYATTNSNPPVSSGGGGGGGGGGIKLSVTKTNATASVITSSPFGINCGYSCVSTFSADSKVILRAAPQVGYHVSSWSGCTYLSESDCIVIIGANTSVSVTFATGTPTKNNQPVNNSPSNTDINTGPTVTALPPIPYIYAGLKVGSNGSLVNGLQTFLIRQGYLGGEYNTGYFGSRTDVAVKKYIEAVVNYQRLRSGGGKINYTASSTPSTSAPTIPYLNSFFVLGTTGEEIKILQKYLISKYFLSPQYVTGYYGPLTESALARYKQSFATTTVYIASTTPTKLTKVQTIGVRDPEVMILQKFLNLNGYTVALFGAGSSGYETDYFGPATKAALMKFQAANMLPASGSLDLATINKINSLIK